MRYKFYVQKCFFLFISEEQWVKNRKSRFYVHKQAEPHDEINFMNESFVN